MRTIGDKIIFTSCKDESHMLYEYANHITTQAWIECVPVAMIIKQANKYIRKQHHASDAYDWKTEEISVAMLTGILIHKTERNLAKINLFRYRIEPERAFALVDEDPQLLLVRAGRKYSVFRVEETPPMENEL